MNRQRIRMIVLAVLLVAAGAYLWTQQSASAVKPAQTASAAAKKPIVPGAKAPTPSATKNPSAPAPATASAMNRPGAVPPAKTATPPPAMAPKPAPAANPPASTAAAAKPSFAPTPSPAPVAATPLAAVVDAPWQDQLQKGWYLAERLRPRLPEGTDLLVASGGFRDLQQFVATVNASHNLKLNFDELKRRVVTDRKGLASAIDAMKKVASATIEEQRAEYEARGLIQEAKRQPAPAAPAAKTASTKEPAAKKPIRTRAGA